MGNSSNNNNVAGFKAVGSWLLGLACVRRNPFMIISISMRLSLSHNENEFNVNIKTSFGRASFAFYNEQGGAKGGERVLSLPSIRVDDEGEGR